MGALVSIGYDSKLIVTMLNWLPSVVPSHVGPGEKRTHVEKSSFRTLCTLHAHSKGVHSFALMTRQGKAKGKILCATCGFERSVFVWDLETAELLRTLDGHRSVVWCLAWDPAEQLLVSLSVDGEMRTWDHSDPNVINKLNQVITMVDHESRISTILFNTHRNCLVTADRRPSMWLYPSRFASREVVAARLLAPQGHSHPLVSVLYSSQFYLVISADELGLICVWDVRTGAQRLRFEHTAGKLTSMAFDSSGRRLVTGSADGHVRLWNFSSGELLRRISFNPTPFNPPQHVLPTNEATPAELPDSPGRAITKSEVAALMHIRSGPYSYYISVGWNRAVCLWPDVDKDPQSGLTLRKLHGHTDDILSVAFCAPTTLCTGSYDGTIIVWNLVSGALKCRLRHPASERGSGHEPLTLSFAVESLCFLTSKCALLSEQVLVAGSSDGSLSFWDARAGRLLLDVPDACGPAEGLLHIAAEETTTFLLTGDSGGFLKVWDISELIEQSVRSEPIGRASVSLLFAWRAHLRAIVRVEHLKGIEGIISASTDCTVRLWSLSGEQIGIFGQEQVWRLGDRQSYHDAEGVELSTPGSYGVDKMAELQARLDLLVPSTGRGPATAARKQRAPHREEHLHVKGQLQRVQDARMRSRDDSARLAQQCALQLTRPKWREEVSQLKSSSSYIPPPVSRSAADLPDRRGASGVRVVAVPCLRLW